MNHGEQPPLMEFDVRNLGALAWHHREKIGPITGQLIAILRDGLRGRQRLLSQDLEQLNALFATEIQILGTEHIPRHGGFVLATSHVISTIAAPGWENRDVNPVWWTAGISSAIRSVRGQEIRPVAYTRDGAHGLHRKIISKIYGGFPVSHGKNHQPLNRVALSRAREAVKQGEIILIAPEGENRVGLSSPKLGGLSRVVEENIPFVPVGFYEQKSDSGTYHYIVSFGAPIRCDFSLRQPDDPPQSLPIDEEDKKRVAAFADRIMVAIAQLLPEEKRGVYKDSV